MGKLRNAKSDIGGFTQWLGRKCRNHNALEELGITRKADQYKARNKGDLAIVADGQENKLLYRSKGRAFKITVEEIDAAELDQIEQIAVGF